MKKKSIILALCIVFLTCKAESKFFLQPYKNFSAYSFDSIEEAAMPIGSSIESGYFVSLSGIKYFIMADNEKNVTYIRTWDKNFLTPEGYSANTVWNKIKSKDCVEFYTLKSIDRKVILLKSGWKLLFKNQDFSNDSISICAYYGEDL